MTSMYRQPNSDYQVSPVDEPLSGTGSKSSDAQPGTGYDYARSLDYETRADWNLDAPSKYDLQGPIPAANRAGGILDRIENHMRSDFHTAVDQRLQPENFAQATADWESEQTPEKMANVATDHDEFDSDATRLDAISFNAETVVQQDDHMKHDFDTATSGDESSGSPYLVPANTRARWELLKSLVRAREGPHEQSGGEESSTSAKNAGSGSKTRPNQFQGSLPARNSSTSMRTLMLPQIVEKRKSIEGLHSDRQAPEATNALQGPLRDQRQESAAFQQHPSNSSVIKQQQTLAHAFQSHAAAHLPAYQSHLPSTEISATSGGHQDPLSTIVSAPQQVSGKSLGDSAMSSASLRPPTDNRSPQPVMPTLQSKAPSPPQQKIRPMPNSGPNTAPNVPSKNQTVLETGRAQLSPPHRPQQTASAIPSSHATTTVVRQGEQKSHSPQIQRRTSLSNASVSSALVQSAATRGSAPVPPLQQTGTFTAHDDPASSPPQATRNEAMASPALVHPNLGGRQHSPAVRPVQQPSYMPPAVTTQQKLGHAQPMPTTSRPLATAQHPQRPPSSQAMQPSPEAAQPRVPSQQMPKTVPTAQPRSKFPIATHPSAPQASAARPPTPQMPAARPPTPQMPAARPPTPQLPTAHQPATYPPAPHPPAPHQPVPHQPVPHQPAPHQPAPHQPVPPQFTPHQPAPNQPAPHQFATHPPDPHQPAPNQLAPHQPVPHQPASRQPAPHQPAPRQPTPDQSTPHQPAPHQPAPHQPATHQPATHPPATHPLNPQLQAPHAPAPQSYTLAPHAPTPSANAAAPKIASKNPPATPQQSPPRAAQASGGTTHGAISQLNPLQQSVIPHTSPKISAQTSSNPNQAQPQHGNPQAATVSGAQESSPLPPPKPPLTSLGAPASQTKHPSETIQSQHVLSVLPNSTSTTYISPTNHSAPLNRPIPPNHGILANQVSSTNDATSGPKQNQAFSPIKAGSGIPSALQASTVSSAPSQNHADSRSGASKSAMPGDASRSNHPSSPPRMSSVVGRNIPISGSDVPQNATQGVHSSRSMPSPTLQARPSNVMSTDSGPSGSESQNDCEAEGSERSNIFKLFGQFAGGNVTEGDLSPEQEAENLVQMFLYGTALVFKSYVNEVVTGNG